LGGVAGYLRVENRITVTWSSEVTPQPTRDCAYLANAQLEIHLFAYSRETLVALKNWRRIPTNAKSISNTAPLPAGRQTACRHRETLVCARTSDDVTAFFCSPRRAARRDRGTYILLLLHA
jgi:hypothetical protein